MRNAICIGCVISAVLLTAMWVRSYKTADRLHGRIWFPTSFVVASKEGRVSVVVFRWHGAESWWRWRFVRFPKGDELSFPFGPVRQYESVLGFGWIRKPLYMVMRSIQTMPDGQEIILFGAATATLRGGGPIIPYWFLVLFVASITVVVKMNWPPRFSLRTLLVAVAVVASVLALETALRH